MEKLRDNLSSRKSVTEVYDLTLEKLGGSLKSTAQSQKPRNRKEIKNCKHFLNAKKNKTNKGDAKKEQTDLKDENYEILHQHREIDIVHSTTVKKDVFFFITTTEKVAQGIKQFFCGANASISGVDTSFNLCNMWVISYKYIIQKQEIILYL